MICGTTSLARASMLEKSELKSHTTIPDRSKKNPKGQSKQTRMGLKMGEMR